MNHMYLTKYFQGGKGIYLLVVISFAYYLVGLYQPIRLYDEGYTVYASARVLNGEIPYRDFMAYQSPGLYYLQAGVFKLIHPSLVLERILSAIFLSGIPIFAYLIARQFASPTSALLTWFICLVENIYWGFGSPGAPALCLSLLSCFLLVRFMNAPTNRRLLFLCGVSTGTTILFRYDYGIYVLIAQTTILILFLLQRLRENKDDLPCKELNVPKAIAPFAFGIFMIIAPVIFLIFRMVPVTDLHFAFVEFPRDIYSKARGLPFPPLIPNPRDAFSSLSSLLAFGGSVHHSFVSYFPMLIFLLTSALLINRVWKSPSQWKRASSCRILLILLLGALFLSVVRVRSDRVHALPSLVYAAILASFLLDDIRQKARLRYVPPIAISMIFVVLTEPIAKRAITFRESVILSRTNSFHLDRGKGIYCRSKDYEDAIVYIQDIVPKGERIFVGNSRHDAIFMNDMVFYFLADRHSATKYHDLHPGIATTLEIQERIIDDIEQHMVRYIVLVEWYHKREPNESSTGSGVTALDDFIREYFELDRTYGSYSIWKRKASIDNQFRAALHTVDR